MVAWMYAGAMAAEFLFLFQLRLMPMHIADQNLQRSDISEKFICPLKFFNLKLLIWRVVHLRSVGSGVLTSDLLFWEQKHVGSSDSASPWSPPLSQSHSILSATASFASSSPKRFWFHGHPKSVSVGSAAWRGSTQTGRTLGNVWMEEGIRDVALEGEGPQAVCGRRGPISGPKRLGASSLGG